MRGLQGCSPPPMVSHSGPLPGRGYKKEILPCRPLLGDNQHHPETLLSAKFERLDDLESRFQADLDNICETFNVERRSIKFEKWRTTP